MKIDLEGKEYELKANGKFLKKYQDLFKTNAIVDLYAAYEIRDAVRMQQIIFAAIDIDISFDEWLGGFKTPLFMAYVFDDVFKYITREFEPTVKPLEDETPKK